MLKARRFIRQNKINFLSTLVTPPAPEGKNKFYVTKEQPQWFTKPERFYIVQYMNTKKGGQVWLYKAFNALSLRRAFLKFRGLVRQDYIRDSLNDRQYGLIVNNQLLLSTSTFKKFVDDKNDKFLTSSEAFKPTGAEYTNDTTAKYFVGFGFQRGLIKMPASVFDADANEYQLFSIDRKSRQPSFSKVGPSRGAAVKAFKKAAASSQRVVVLLDKEGRGIKFSSKNKPEMYTLLADFLQTAGNFMGTVLDEEQAGFELLPTGERPGRAPDAANSHHRRA